MSRDYPLERLFGRVLTPFERFLQRTTAGGLVLVGTTVATLVLAAALGGEGLHHFWERRLAVDVGGVALIMTRHQVVNDGLMALFFLLVGLELKRELLVGELSALRDAMLPIVAALGGMVVPALVYAAFNAGTPGAAGWGIPMATDIAFAIGVLVLLAWRVPPSLIVFLTALAIADDLGAVLVIAVFYSADLNATALWVAASLLALLAFFNRGGIRHPLPYALAGVALWLAVLASGVHATLAGILLAFAIPVLPASTPAQFEERVGGLIDAFRADRRDLSTPDDPLRNAQMATMAEAIERSAVAVQSPLHRMEHSLTPWVTFVVIPVFAVANAGIDLTQIDWRSAFAERVTLGVLAGLVLGKFAGIAGFSWIAIRLGVARLPAQVRWSQFLGAAWLGGIGFTMSIFIAQLAFPDPALVEQAKLGILLASALSAALGTGWLLAVSRGR